jgi:hypothetical protein
MLGADAHDAGALANLLWSQKYHAPVPCNVQRTAYAMQDATIRPPATYAMPHATYETRHITCMPSGCIASV